jgi:hypothetical protein
MMDDPYNPDIDGVAGSCILIAWMAKGAKQRENMARISFWEE